MTQERASQRGAKLRTAVGYLIAIAGLAWVFHDVSLRSMLESVRGVRWSWVALAIAIDILSYVTQGLRWKLLLRPVGDVPWIDATRAIYAGLFASEVLPMRPGEVLRAVLVSRSLNAPVSAVVPSILVERLFDGVWLAIGMGIAAILLPLPEGLRRAGDVFGVLILLATVAFLYEVRWVRDRPRSLEEGDTPKPPGRVERFRRRFREIGRRRETYVAFGLSLLFLVGQAVAFWLVAIAYRLPLGFWASVLALIVIHVGTAVPNTPGNVGTYQFFCVVALTLLGVDKTLATGFSVVVFITLTVPLWLLGSLALGRSGTTLAGVRARFRERRVGS